MRFSSSAAGLPGVCAFLGLMAMGLTQAQSWWKPSPKDHLSWQWQIGAPPAPAEILDVDMYDVDLFDTPKATIDALKKQGTKVTCYFSAGTYEGWRTDWRIFFPFITGTDYQ